MKNTVRVHKNRSASLSRRQAKTPPANIVTVVFYSVDNDQELARVDFPKRVFNIFKRAGKEQGIPLDKFFEAAIRNKIENWDRGQSLTVFGGGAK
jgi:hypothetical protein